MAVFILGFIIGTLVIAMGPLMTCNVNIFAMEPKQPGEK
jgi:hypothetical protein